MIRCTQQKGLFVLTVLLFFPNTVRVLDSSLAYHPPKVALSKIGESVAVVYSGGKDDEEFLQTDFFAVETRSAFKFHNTPFQPKIDKQKLKSKSITMIQSA